MYHLRIITLEERIVLDGALALDVSAGIDSQNLAPAVGEDAHVVIISDNIPDADTLADAVNDGIIVATYDYNYDSLSDLTAKNLAGRASGLFFINFRS